jgi:hypothetical protein
MYAASLAAVAFLLPIWPALALYRGDTAFGGAEDQRAVDRLRLEVEPGDVVVIDPYASPLWSAMINTWASPVHWSSLPIELPDPYTAGAPGDLPPEVEALFRQLLSSSTTVWYVASANAPAPSVQAKLNWLAENASLTREIVVEIEGSSSVLRGFRAVDG